MDQASFSLDSLPTSDSACPHCGKSEHSVSHGYLYKQVSIDRREVVGKRILCSRRDGRHGCGRTRQWYLADVVPGRQYRLSVFIAFVSALLGGDAVESAYLKATRSSAQPRHAWRWLQSFIRRLPHWRTGLSLATETLAARSRSSTVHILLPTLHSLSRGLGGLRRFQSHFQCAFC